MYLFAANEPLEVQKYPLRFPPLPDKVCGPWPHIDAGDWDEIAIRIFLFIHEREVFISTLSYI